MKKQLWYKEYHNEDFYISFRVEEHLFSGTSEYQKIDVFKNKFFGNVLFLDGLLMITEKDEYFYHEAITHPAMDNVRSVCIIGGGDGGTLREVLKYGVDEVYLVEIDKMVIEVSKKFFKKSAKSFEDKRVKIINEDGVDFIKKFNSFFDLIIVDSSEPLGPSKKLFEKEFYLEMKKKLNSKGKIVAQLGSYLYHKEFIKNFISALKNIFKTVITYTLPTPTYPGGLWVYGIFSDSFSISDVNIDKRKTKYINTELFKGSIVKL